MLGELITAANTVELGIQNELLLRLIKLTSMKLGVRLSICDAAFTNLIFQNIRQCRDETRILNIDPILSSGSAVSCLYWPYWYMRFMSYH
jgi:hypothetical protein